MISGEWPQKIGDRLFLFFCNYENKFTNSNMNYRAKD
jgi:hypothetical protein